MKRALSYKSKRNIIIASVILLLLAGISTVGYFYIKGSNEEAKAFTQNNMINGEQATNDTNNEETNQENNINQNDNQLENNEQVQENQPTEKQQEQTDTEQENQQIEASNSTTNQTTTEIQEQEFITEEIVEQDVLVSEDFMVEWIPANIQANTTIANLEIIRPIISAVKQADKTVVAKDEIITYTIIVTNTGKIDGKATIQDTIQKETKFVTNSIEIDETKTEYTAEDLENGNIEVTVPANGEIKLTFKVTATTQLKYDEKIKNVAYVNDTPTNEVIIDMPNIQVEKTVFMKNGEVIPEDQLATVTFEENDVVGYKIVVTNTGTIKLNNIILKDILENNKQIYLNNPETTTNTIIDYDDNVSLESNESKEYIVYYKVKREDVIKANEKNSLENEVTAIGHYTTDEGEIMGIEDKDTAEIKFKLVPNTTIKKIGELADGTNANNTTLKYGDTITYILTAKNTGTKHDTAVIKDADIKTLVEAGNVEIISDIKVEHYKIDGSTKTETITSDKVKRLAENGVEVYVPAEKTATVTFTVKVTAAPGTTIKNTVVGGEGTVINYVEKQVTVTSSGQKDKNIVIVLDLSNSMLFEAGTYSYGSEFASKYDGSDESRIQVLTELNSSTSTKLYAAKQAIKTFANQVLKDNPNNQITLITFNFESLENAIANTSSLYGSKMTTYEPAQKYIGTQVLVSATNNASKIIEEVDDIQITHPLLTNIVAAMNLTKTTVETLAQDQNRDVEVIFLGDGRPSFNTENCAKNGGFYTNGDINDTNSTLYHINQAATAIKNTGAHIYTVAYELTAKEAEYANQVFNTMSSGSVYRMSASSANLNAKLAQIGNAITYGYNINTETTDATGKVEFQVNSGVLNVGPSTPITLTIGTAKYTFNSVEELNNAQIENHAKQEIIKYVDNKFIIYANNINASATISLRYYYTASN